MKAGKHKKIFNMLVYLFSFIALALIMLLIILIIRSPGKIQSFTDENENILAGSISEKVFVNIGGVKQGMFIRGKDLKNPVLLYIHGGPAFPNYFLIEKYSPGLEENFTVCYWEQRGGGLSYGPEVTLESMNFEQLTSDAIEVTNYLRERFGKEKIFMMAHSGGTPFAIMTAARAPQLYYAYIGMAQITRQAESEKIAYKYMLEQYTANGNEKAVDELKKYSVLDSDNCIVPFYKSLTRDESMHELGIGTMRNMRSVFKGVFIPVWTCKAYTLREKINIWISKFSFIKKTKLIDELFATDIPAGIPKLEIPVYFFSGKYDLTVNHDLSKAYLEKLQAPLKGFYTFSESAHSPIYEEPQRMKEIMVNDVLCGTNKNGDRN
ncbi:MAG: alpha/beta hydrolase [Ignavibacteria bacterium]|nr:alpha/beta hydrolase [Ignavibacteria bacterium]